MITKKKKKPTRKQQTKFFDKIRSDLVKIRAWYKCEYCWKTTYLNSHHIFTRNNYSTRFDLDNWICLCTGHHTFNPYFSAHRTPTEFTERVKEYRWQKRYDSLKYKANQIRDKDYDRIQFYLDQKEKELCIKSITEKSQAKQ